MPTTTLTAKIRLEDQMTKSLGRLENRVAQAAGRMEKSMKKAAGTFRDTAILLASFTIFQRTFAKLFGGFVEFESGLAAASTVMDTTKVNLEEIGDEILRLRSITGKGFPELTEALSEAVQRGIDPSIAPRFLELASKGAIAAGSDLVDQVKILTGVMDAYALELDQAGLIQDAFFAAQDVGNFKIREIKDQLGRLLPVAALVGKEYKEMLAALVALTRAGLTFPEAVTRMVRAITSLTKEKKKAKEVAEELGIEFDVTAFKSSTLLDFVRKLSDAVGDDAEQFAKLVPEIRAFQAFAILAANDSKLLKEGLDAVNSSAGRTEREFAKVTDTISFKFGQVKGSISAITTTLAREIAPSIKRFLDDVQGAFQETLNKNKENLKLFANSIRLIFGQQFRLISLAVSTLATFSSPIFSALERGFLVITLGIEGTITLFLRLVQVAFTGLEKIGIGANELGKIFFFVIKEIVKFFEGLVAVMSVGVGGLLFVLSEVVSFFDDDWGAALQKASDDVVKFADDMTKGPLSKGIKAGGFIQSAKQFLEGLDQQVIESEKRIRQIMGQIAALAGRDDLNKALLGENAKRTAQQLKEIAEAIKNTITAADEAAKLSLGDKGWIEGFVNGLERVEGQIEETFRRGTKAGEKFAKGAQKAIEDFFLTPLDENITSISQALEKLGRDFLRLIAQVAAQRAAAEVVGAILPAAKKEAKGGIDYQGARLPIRGYQTGGIISRPEVSIRGEGSKREAVVPLPDGKSIPVSLDGGGGGGVNMGDLNVTVVQEGFLDLPTDTQAQIIADGVKRKLVSDHGLRQAIANANRNTL